jgi:pimeloyl-ACP methyl ester carboxylesterase
MAAGSGLRYPYPMIVFAHGLEGSPQGRKAQRLGQLSVPLLCPDLRGVPLQGRYDQIDRITRDRRCLLVGSSYGGLVAALLAARHPERLHGLLLCAPALGWREPPNDDPEALCAPPGLPVTILHGLRDEVVPIELSRAYQQRSPPGVRLLELDDDHPLRGSIDLLEREARSMLEVPVTTR